MRQTGRINLLVIILLLLFCAASNPVMAKTLKSLVAEKEFLNQLSEITSVARSRSKDMFIVYCDPATQEGKAFEQEILTFPEFSQKVDTTEFVCGHFNSEQLGFDLSTIDAARLATKSEVKSYPAVILLNKEGMLYGRIHFNGKKADFWVAFDEARKSRSKTISAWKAVNSKAKMIFSIATVLGFLGVVMISTITLYVLLDGEVSLAPIFGIVFGDTLFKLFIPYGIWISTLFWLIGLIHKKGIGCFLTYILVTGSIGIGFIKVHAAGFLGIINYFCPPPL